MEDTTSFDFVMNANGKAGRIAEVEEKRSEDSWTKRQS